MGKVTSRYDDDGHEKVQCRECQGWYHRLDVHLSKKHGMDVKEYQSCYPGALTISDWARSMASEGQKKGEAADDSDAPMKFGVASLALRKDLSAEDRVWIPKHDEGWNLGETERAHLEALGLAMQDDLNVLIVGPPGVGKSTLVRELAALIDQPLRRLPFHGEMRVRNLVGGQQIRVDDRTGQAVTTNVPGPLVEAAQRGHWVLLDEFDAAPPHVAFVLHSVLERPRQLTLVEEDGGREVEFHSNFRVVATANTLGHGDDTGLYAGTTPQNEALLDRFGIVIRMEYPTRDEEVKILTERAPGLGEDAAAKMHQVADTIRKANASDSALVSLSPRRLIAWAQVAVRLSDVRRAARLTIVNKLGPDDAKAVEGIIQRFWGGAV